MDLFIASPPGRVVNTVRGVGVRRHEGNSKGWGSFRRGSRRLRRWCNSRSRRLALPYGPVIGDIVDVLRAWEAAVPILIKPFLYVIAFRPIAVLFASVIGLVCWLLIMCVRAIAWLPTTGQRPRNSANLPRRRTSSPAPMRLCSYAQSPPRQRPAEGHGGHVHVHEGGQAIVGNVESRWTVRIESEGTTPCTYPCTRRHDAGRGRAATAHVSRLR